MGVKGRMALLVVTVLGGALATAGVAMVYVPAAFVLAGVALVYVGAFVDWDRERRGR